MVLTNNIFLLKFIYNVVDLWKLTSFRAICNQVMKIHTQIYIKLPSPTKCLVFSVTSKQLVDNHVIYSKY